MTEETKKDPIKEAEKQLTEKKAYLQQVEGAKEQTIANINFLMGKIDGLKAKKE